jgi:hypothetical protein
MLDQVEGLSDILAAHNFATAAETASANSGTKQLLLRVFYKSRAAYPQIYPQLSGPRTYKSRLLSYCYSISAITPKADISRAHRHVRFVPIVLQKSFCITGH